MTKQEAELFKILEEVEKVARNAMRCCYDKREMAADNCPDHDPLEKALAEYKIKYSNYIKNRGDCGE